MKAYLPIICHLSTVPKVCLQVAMNLINKWKRGCKYTCLWLLCSDCVSSIIANCTSVSTLLCTMKIGAWRCHCNCNLSPLIFDCKWSTPSRFWMMTSSCLKLNNLVGRAWASPTLIDSTRTVSIYLWRYDHFVNVAYNSYYTLKHEQTKFWLVRLRVE